MEPVTPERQRRIEDIYDAALGYSAAERPAFLDVACGGDAAVRAGVESLLAREQAPPRISPSAVDVTENALTAGSLQIGMRFGAYEVLSCLGVGGMGQVYRARDRRLGRDVAIKILSHARLADPDRERRFLQEARAASALNHPHIVTLHDIVHEAGLNFLVMEYVPGKSLDRLIRAKGLPLIEAVGYAQQIASALAAAHAAGIVHRDIKPANVIVTPAGQVKILDFGLAKLIERGPEDSGAETRTQAALLTEPGMVLGTVAYMSPEQASGRGLDQRTDIFSLGVVLYELLAGQRPFRGRSSVETLHAIINDPPPPLAQPPELQDLLDKALAKDPNDRYQHAGDFALDLRRSLQRPPETRRGSSGTGWSSRLPWSVAAVFLLALPVAWWAGRATPEPESASPQFSRVTRVTSGPAREFGPAISPDGKWVAYVSNVRGPTDVWVKFLAGGEAANLTASAGLDITATTGIGGLDISPDGTRIAVMARLRGSTGAFSTWEIPAPLPGDPRKLLDDGFLGMRWSPDGRQITFIRAGSSAGDALWIADEDGTNRREIVKANGGVHIHWPTWSREGRIYFIRTITPVANLDQTEIYRIDSKGGAIEPVVTTLRRAMFPVPMPNGGLIYSANPTGAELSLWWHSAKGSEPQRLTTGVGEYAEPRISSDGRTLVFALYELRQSLIRVALAGSRSAQASALTDGYGGDLDPSIAPGGDRLVFSSSRTGDRHLWTARIDGSEIRALTAGAQLDDRPTFSPDGQQVAFISDRGGSRGIWITNADGGTPRKVAAVSPTGGLSWSPDGRQIVYAASAGDWPGLWTVSVSDGDIRRLPTPGAAADPAWAPARNLIAYLAPATTGPGYAKLAFVDSTGQPQLLALPPAPDISGGFVNGMAAWSPDGERLAVVSQNTNAAASIWTIEPDALKASYQKLIELPIGPRIRGLSWTRDGSALIIGQHDTTSDIVLLSDVR